MSSFANLPWGRLTSLYERELLKIFKLFRPAAPTKSALRAVAKNPKFLSAAEKVAERMVAEISRVNAVSWREAATRATHSREIYHALQNELRDTGAGKAIRRLVRENAELIRSIPIDLAQRVTRQAELAAEQGLRASQVEKDLQHRLAHLTAGKIRLIARTEVAKGQSAITRVRAEQLDLDWYQWATSKDSRVRDSHRNMDLVLVKWSDPPSPELLVHEHDAGHYAPGGIYNCRCAALPLVSLDEVCWPCRVYTAGAITMMNRTDFRRLANWPKAA